MNIFDNSRPFTFDRTIRLGITILIVYFLVRFIGYISDVLIPFAVAIIFAYLLNPITNWFHKKIKVRVLAVLITLIIVFGVIAGSATLIIPRVAKEVSAMSTLISNYVSNIDFQQQLSERIPDKLNEFLQELLASEKINEFLTSEKSVDYLVNLMNKILPGIWGIISGTATIITTLLAITIVIMYLFFMLLDYEKFNKGWRELLPENWKTQIITFVHDFETIMSKYFRNQAVIALIIGILFSISFSILGMPLGIVIGLFLGLLNMVPYLQIIGIVPTMFSVTMLCLSTGTNFWIITIIIVIIFTAIQMIQDYVLVPLIMGKVTGFNPAIIVLSLTIWGKILGLLGLIIALPMTYLIYTYYKIYILNIKQPTEQNNELTST